MKPTRRSVLRTAATASGTAGLAGLASQSAAASGSDYEITVGAKSGRELYEVHVPILQDAADNSCAQNRENLDCVPSTCSSSDECTCVEGTEYTESSQDDRTVVEVNGEKRVAISGVVDKSCDDDPDCGDLWEVCNGGDLIEVETDGVNVSTSPL